MKKRGRNWGREKGSGGYWDFIWYERLRPGEAVTDGNYGKNSNITGQVVFYLFPVRTKKFTSNSISFDGVVDPQRLLFHALHFAFYTLELPLTPSFNPMHHTLHPSQHRLRYHSMGRTEYLGPVRSPRETPSTPLGKTSSLCGCPVPAPSTASVPRPFLTLSFAGLLQAPRSFDLPRLVDEQRTQSEEYPMD